MFSVVNSNISSVVLRVGADNKSNSSLERLRSIYFQKFTYPNSVLNMLAPSNNRVNNNPSDFKIFPTVFKNAIGIQLRAASSGIAQIRLVNYSGIIVKQQMLYMQEGNNKININNWNNIPAGNYILIISQNNTIHHQKVIKQ